MPRFLNFSLVLSSQPDCAFSLPLLLPFFASVQLFFLYPTGIATAEIHRRRFDDGLARDGDFTSRPTFPSFDEYDFNRSFSLDSFTVF